MNILFVTIAWPEKGERNLYSDLIDEFVRNGHEVFVLCAEADGPGCPPVKENEINVLRVPTLQIRKVKKISKAIALFSLGSKMFRSALKNWSGLRIDLIIGHSPPVTLSGLYRRLKNWYNSPVYYLLKDIWPHGPADLGLIQRNGIIFRFFRYHEVRMYKTADYIGCMSEMNVDYIIRENRYLNPEKVEVCPNTISPRALEIKEDVKGIRNRHNIPENATVFIFSGNLGKAHGLDFYINVIESLKDYERAFFLIGGSGLYYRYIASEIQKRKLTNARIYERLPAGEFDQLLMSCDVGVILLDKRYRVPQFPSRLLAYLEAGKPVLCSVNKATDIGTIVERSGCGITTLHGVADSFVKAVKYFCEIRDNELFDNMKLRSRDLLRNAYTSESSYKIIMSHFNEQISN